MDATWVRRKPRLLRAALAGTALALAIAAAAYAGSHQLGHVLPILTSGLFLAGTPFVYWLLYADASRERAKLDARARLLRVLGSSELTFEPTSGRAASLPDGRWRVELTRGLLGRLRVEVGSRDEARALLETLGLDQREGTTRFVVHSNGFEPLFTLAPITLALLTVVLIGAHQAVPLVPALILSAVGLAFVNRRVTVTIGRDGVEIAGLSRRTFLPHSQIRSVKRAAARHPKVVGTGLEIELHDGRVLRLDTRAERMRTGNWTTDPVLDALEAARARAATRPAAGAALLRGDRTTKEWVASLRGLSAGHGDYRSPALDDDALENVIGDAGSPVEARAAAIVALRAKDPQKLRVALESVADREVHRFATDDDAELEDALDAFERPKAKRMR